jgi:hypothetical protein
MNCTTRVILTCVLLWAGSCCTVMGGEYFSSWKQLEQDLFAEIKARPGDVRKDVYLSWEYLKGFKTAQRIERLEPGVWLELAKQSDTGLLQLVAYHCIVTHAPQHTTDAALAIAMSSPTIIRHTEGSGPGEHLRNLESSEENLLSFSVIMCTKYDMSQRINFVVTIGHIREAFLVDWSKGRHALPILASNEAQVVGHLLSPKRQLPNDVRVLLRQKLKGYAPVPGIARVMFLAHAAPNERELLELTKMALTDPDLLDPELILALRPHYDSIRNHLEELSKVEGEVAKRRLSRLRKELDRE